MNLILEGMNGSAVADMLKVMPNTKSIPIILHDGTGARVPAASGNASGGGIVATVSSNEPSEIHAVVTRILT